MRRGRDHPQPSGSSASSSCAALRLPVRVVRVLVRDLRAAAREPRAELGRLVVVASPRASPPRARLRPRRGHDPRPRRQQLDRGRGRVRLGGPRRADVPRPGLVRRGPRRARTARSSTAAGRRLVAGRLRRRDPGRPGPPPARAARGDERAAARERGRAGAAPASSGRSGRVPAGASSTLLGVVAVAPDVGSVSLGATLAARGADGGAGIRRRVHARTARRSCAIYLGALLVAHLAQVLAGRRTDQVLLPAVGLLGGIGLLLMERLPAGPRRAASADWRQTQLVWLLIALAIVTVARDRRPIGHLAAPLQVHVGGGRRRPAAAHLRLRRRRQRRAADALDRADQRPAVRAAEGDPRRLPGRLPVGEPGAARRGVDARSGRSGCRRCRTSRRWSRCGRSPSASSSSSATSGPRSCSSPSSCCCCTSRRRAQLRRHRACCSSWPVRGSCTSCSATSGPGRHLARSVRRPARRRLPGRPGALRLRAAAASSGPGWAAACR